MGRPLKWQANPVMQNIISKNRTGKDELHWLELQKAERYVWRKNMRRMPESVRTYYRRMGIVENLFDEDGSSYCGRADLHQNLRFELKTDLTDQQLRERILLAWTIMRQSHILLSSSTAYLHDIREGPFSERWIDKCFVYAWPKTVNDAITATRAEVIFVADEYPEIDARDFFRHVMNTSRALDQKKSLSRLYVMPFKHTKQGTVLLHMIAVLAHQITDGLTTYRWNRHLTTILNSSNDELLMELEHLLTDDTEMLQRLPHAQEALYPVRSFNPARERWHWLMTRILRHVHRPPPASFQNPLRRTKISNSQRFPSKYDKVINYNTVPPLNAGNISVDVEGRAMQNIRFLCKQAGISVGSGCFVLVAMTLMALEERRNPDVALEDRLPFVGSFPVNPRPFFSGQSTTGKEDSCMLAFSDGVTLPFLSGDLDLVGRFKLLGRQAHRQLRQYQKKRKSQEEELHLGSKSPSQLIPALYCSTLERMEGRVKSESKAGFNVSEKYPAATSPTLATCGISSVGDVSGVAPPKVDLENTKGKDLAADLRGFSSTVRPRDGEFLVGAVGHKDSLGFGVSYDATAIDPARCEEWTQLMRTMLDRDLDLAPVSKL